MLKRMLVAIDGSENADRALDLACDLALKYDAEIHLLHVVRGVAEDPPPESLVKYAELEHLDIRDAAWSMGNEVLQSAANRVRRVGEVKLTTKLRAGDPSKEIEKAVGQIEADAVVMGRRGLGPLKEMLVGSVSSKVMRSVSCTCLVVT